METAAAVKKFAPLSEEEREEYEEKRKLVCPKCSRRKQKEEEICADCVQNASKWKLCACKGMILASGPDQCFTCSLKKNTKSV